MAAVCHLGLLKVEILTAGLVRGPICVIVQIVVLIGQTEIWPF